MGIEGNNGVIQSSIALLQERFKQLQREKEMRQRREFLRSTMNIISSSSSSSSDSECENYNITNNESLKLLFTDEVAIQIPPPLQLSPYPPPPHHSHHQHHQMIDLSLWPAGSERVDNAVLKNLLEKKYEENKRLYSCEWLSCDDSHASDDVDTSLRL